jgi:multimeric flavodoxin WrbA
MTRVIGFIGSPRPTGNTAIMVNTLLAGAAEGGAETATVLLNALNMRGCQSCYHCKSAGDCAVQDDLTPFFHQIAQADVVVIGSPIYMGAVTAQCKLLLDRLYSFIKSDFTTRLAPGKTAIILIAQGNPNESEYAAYFAALKRMLGIAFSYVEDVIVAAGVRECGEVTQHTELMERVRDLGRRLGGGAI